MIDRRVTYTIGEGTAHILKGTHLCVNLPTARVIAEHADTIRIAWPENVGHHVTEKAVFEYGAKIKLELPSIFLDAEHQYNLQRGAGKRKMYDANIGNLPELTNFSTYLPSRPLYVKQPWFYWGRKTFWPLFKYNKNPTNHVYTFRSYESLLRIQQLQDGVWVTLTSDKENVGRYVVFGETETPVLKGRFGQLSEEEYSVNTEKGCIEKSKVFIRDVVVLTSENEKQYDSPETLSLKSGHICSYFYYMASDTRNKLTANYSNYRNQQGDHSVVSSSLLYGGNPLFENFTPQDTNAGQGEYFPSVPRQKGYNVYTFVNDPNNEDADSAPVLGNGSPETNTALSVVVSGDAGCKYRLSVVMVVLRALVTEQEKNGSFSVSLE